MAKKILFIDGQVFQSAAWDRGMGKYSLALLKSMTRNKAYDYNETHIIFNKSLPLPTDAKKLIKEAAPNANHIFCDVEIPFDASMADIPKLQQSNQEILDALINQYSQGQDNEISYLILSLFIDQVCSVFPSNGRKIIVIYDLIPLQYSDRYSLLTSYNNHLARYKVVFEADILLTISQTVANDIALNLGISPPKIFNIDGAPIDRSLGVAKKPSFKVPERYVLVPSGNEIRKNNARAVQGFETYLQESQSRDTFLLLTSTFDERTRHELEAYSQNIIFTGNVGEKELRWLYEHTEALLFVPEYEGLGLPILEAAEAGKPIVCSSLTVFNEMSPTAFYYSDPFDPFDIADALGKAITQEGFSDKIKEYPKILKKYTWPNTASHAMTALAVKKSSVKPKEKVRLAILTPSPAGYSAVGKLVMQLHPAMQEYFDIDYYVEEGRTHKEFTRPDYLQYIANVFPAARFDKKKYKAYDAVLYNIGNSEFHIDTIKSALYLPGFAIFHDTHLNYIFEGELLTCGYVTQDRLEAERLLDKKIGNQRTSYLSSIVNNQLGMIAHSKYTQDALKKSCVNPGATPVLKTNLPTASPEKIVTNKKETELTIGLAGIIHPAKGLAIIEEIANSNDFSDCKIHIFGMSLVSEEIIRRLRAYPNVQVDTSVTDFQFQNMLSQLDILINFRPEYKGEASLATVEAMRFGVVPIVKKIGWYDELPGEAAVKVDSPKEVVKKLRHLISDTTSRSKMKEAARKFVAKNHSYHAYAQALYEFITSTRGQDNVDRISHVIKDGASVKAVQSLEEGIDVTN